MSTRRYIDRKKLVDDFQIVCDMARRMTGSEEPDERKASLALIDAVQSSTIGFILSDEEEI